MRRVDEVMRQRLVHVVDDVQPLRRHDPVFLAAKVTSERLQTDLVWAGKEGALALTSSAFQTCETGDEKEENLSPAG